MENATWNLDTTHSNIGFSVRHMVFAKVRGRFATWSGTARLDAQDLTRSSVEVEIDANSIDTGVGDRDNHLRSADFFDVENHPTMQFRSTGVRIEDGDFLVDGDLTIRGVTKPATFELEFGGFGVDPWGSYKAGATAKTVVNREDFGLTWNAALEAGGFLVGKNVTIELDVELVKA